MTSLSELRTLWLGEPRRVERFCNKVLAQNPIHNNDAPIFAWDCVCAARTDPLLVFKSLSDESQSTVEKTCCSSDAVRCPSHSLERCNADCIILEKYVNVQLQMMCPPTQAITSPRTSSSSRHSYSAQTKMNVHGPRSSHVLTPRTTPRRLLCVILPGC